MAGMLPGWKVRPSMQHAPKEGGGQYSESVNLRPDEPAEVKGWHTSKGGRRFSMARVTEVPDDTDDGLARAHQPLPNTLWIFVTRYHGRLMYRKQDRQTVEPDPMPPPHQIKDDKKWYERASLTARLGDTFRGGVKKRHTGKCYPESTTLATLKAVLETAEVVELRQKNQQGGQQPGAAGASGQHTCMPRFQLPSPSGLQFVVGSRHREIVDLEQGEKDDDVIILD